MRVEQLRERYDVDVRWVFFPLHPETPADGRSLEDLFAGRGMDIPAMQARLAGVMREEGLPYGARTHTYNSRLAQELAAWADASGHAAAPRLHHALYRAYFVDARNIGDRDVLVDVASAAGFDAAAAQAAIDTRAGRERVDEDWKKAHAYGVTGVPTFVAGGRGAVGAQPYEMLERLVVDAGAEKRG